MADLRAPTPSAAAELAVFDYEQVQERLDMSAQRMFHQMKQRMEFARGRIREYQLQLKALHPKNQLLQKRQYLTDLEEAGTADAGIFAEKTTSVGNVCSQAGMDVHR